MRVPRGAGAGREAHGRGREGRGLGRRGDGVDVDVAREPGRRALPGLMLLLVICMVTPRGKGRERRRSRSAAPSTQCLRCMMARPMDRARVTRYAALRSKARFATAYRVMRPDGCGLHCARTRLRNMRLLTILTIAAAIVSACLTGPAEAGNRSASGSVTWQDIHVAFEWPVLRPTENAGHHRKSLHIFSATCDADTDYEAYTARDAHPERAPSASTSAGSTSAETGRNPQPWPTFASEDIASWSTYCSSTRLPASRAQPSPMATRTACRSTGNKEALRSTSRRRTDT